MCAMIFDVALETVNFYKHKDAEFLFVSPTKKEILGEIYTRLRRKPEFQSWMNECVTHPNYFGADYLSKEIQSKIEDSFYMILSSIKTKEQVVTETSFFITHVCNGHVERSNALVDRTNKLVIELTQLDEFIRQD